MRYFSKALAGLPALAFLALLLMMNSAWACGTSCQAIPSVASIPYVLPQDERQRERRASPPVFTARVHECVVREVTLTARTRELLAEREAQARQRAECLPAGTREAYALQVQRNAELAEKVSELQAEIIRLQDLMLAVLPPQPERQEPLAPPQGP